MKIKENEMQTFASLHDLCGGTKLKKYDISA